MDLRHFQLLSQVLSGTVDFFLFLFSIFHLFLASSNCVCKVITKCLRIGISELDSEAKFVVCKINLTLVLFIFREKSCDAWQSVKKPTEICELYNSGEKFRSFKRQIFPTYCSFHSYTRTILWIEYKRFFDNEKKAEIHCKTEFLTFNFDTYCKMNLWHFSSPIFPQLLRMIRKAWETLT